MRTVLALLAALAMLPHAASAEAQTVCPAANQRARYALEKFLSSETTLPTRQKDGWSDVSAANLRLLTDAADNAVCQRLRNGIQLRRNAAAVQWAFFYANGYYFVSTIKVNPPGSFVLGHNSLIVLRSDLSLVGSYAN